MAEKITLARPYARALFEDAVANKQLKEWLKTLELLSQTIVDPSLSAVIKNPEVTFKQLTEIIVDLLKPGLKEQNKEFQNRVEHFIFILADARRVTLLPEIYQLYAKMLEEREKQIKVSVSSPFPLSDDMIQKIKSALEKRFKAQIVIDFGLDQSLIGGAVIRTDDWVIDGSIREKLNRLSASLLR